MYKSAYLNRIYDWIQSMNGCEKEFLNAIEEFLDSMEYLVEKDPNIEKNQILERLVIPERVFQFRVSWVDDNGKIQVNNAYRIQFNSAIGPYKGGMRFDKSVNLSILKFLAFEQIFKNSLTGLPMGGGKGGSDFDPRDKSDNEIMKFCQAYMAELYHFIGPDMDVPAGDLGFGAREVGYMFGYYKKLTKEHKGVFTGKGLAFGGSLVRTEATGYGLCYFVMEMLKKYKNDSLKGKKVIVSGKGNVAMYAALKARELGATVVAMSDRSGYIACDDGLDLDLIKEIANAKRRSILEYSDKYPSVIKGSNVHDIWGVKCDIAMPCATQTEINIDDAKKLVKNGCFMVAEGANMPTELEAVRYFMENGVIFSPGKASNAGGVSVSGLEMSQNAEHLSWSFKQVDEMLKEIMKNIFDVCYNTAKEFGDETNLSLGANIAGFKKVYAAMLAEGVI